MTEITEAVPPPGAGTHRRPAPQQAELDPRRWLALASVMTAFFMVLLDVSIVNVAIPAIRSNLPANDADIQFVIAGYGLAYAVLLITGGRLGDIFGRKKLFIIGMSGFVLASALCGLAQSAIMLDLSRVLQGAMAAMMYPQVLSVIQVTFPPAERARVFGFVGAVIGIATITGPLVGGLIIRDDITGGSWRWIFLVNLPIGIASLIAATRLVSESKAPNAKRLDLVGVLLATAGILLLVYPLVEGQVAGWPAWTFICMALSPVMLVLFVLYERSLPSTRFPLVQLSMFSIPILPRRRRHLRGVHRRHPGVLLHLQSHAPGRTGIQRAQCRVDDHPLEHRIGGGVGDVDSRRPASRQVDDRDRLGTARHRDLGIMSRSTWGAHR